MMLLLLRSAMHGESDDSSMCEIVSKMKGYRLDDTIILEDVLNYSIATTLLS